MSESLNTLRFLQQTAARMATVADAPYVDRDVADEMRRVAADIRAEAAALEAELRP